jgi:hypothetical protein
MIICESPTGQNILYQTGAEVRSEKLATLQYVRHGTAFQNPRPPQIFGRCPLHGFANIFLEHQPL